MFSHVTVGASDLERAGAFYDAVLIPLGLGRREVEPDGGPPALCWVSPHRAFPMFFVFEPYDGRAARAGNGAMVSFIAPSREALDRAYAAGLAAHGSDEGPPGPRPHYAPDYYGAYMRDPDGNKICLVHRPSLERFGAAAE
ncbi:MAG: VOC family protein [Pseudomonadota bacterium]